MFAKIDPEGAVLKYPYTLEQFRRDHPGEDITDLADATEFGVVPVEDSPQPELAEGQTLDEGLPINSNGVYVRNWIVHNWLTIEQGGLYARIDGETVIYPYTVADVRRDFGVASRADSIKQMDGEFGVVPVDVVPAPEIEPYEVAEPGGIDEYEPGKWRQVWTIRDKTADELRADVPQSVTMRQARLIALDAGLLEAIEDAISGMDEASKIEWEYALEVRRDHPLIASLSSTLGLTETQVDDLFRAAAQIQ